MMGKNHHFNDTIVGPLFSTYLCSTSSEAAEVWLYRRGKIYLAKGMPKGLATAAGDGARENEKTVVNACKSEEKRCFCGLKSFLRTKAHFKETPSNPYETYLCTILRAAVHSYGIGRMANLSHLGQHLRADAVQTTQYTKPNGDKISMYGYERMMVDEDGMILLTGQYQ